MFKSVKSKVLASHLITAAVAALAAAISGHYVILKDYAFFILAFIFIFAALGAKVLASNITAPLAKLAAASNAVARGNLSGINDVRVKEKEIITLVEAFNKMTSNLSTILISKDYVENVFRSISDSIVIVDEEGRIKTANSATLDMLGYSKDEIIGKPAGLLFGEETGEGDIRKIRYESTHRQRLENFTSTYVAKSQKQIQVMISGSLLTDREGTGYDLVVVGKDITERKKQEEELQSMLIKLEQSNRELQDFAHIASHDLQEPLRKIMAFGNRLQSKYTDKLDDQGRDYLNRMRNAAVRMQSLIQSLLMYSRVTTKAQPFAPVDLPSVVKEVLSDLEVRIQETGGQIVDLDKLPVVSADPHQMRQLFQNLIGNALKFNKKDEPPVVKISCRPADGNGNGASDKGLYEITVEDNGIGFDEKYLDRIFGVFQRLHGRNDFEGSGIGLSVCRKIVMRHGGNITAKSAPGQGARFIFTLPAAGPQEAAPDMYAADTAYE
ncbi:MAG: PAS domain S-box protein [Nitrospirae bacterium]|nr:PAS domain S-box protein [Nitrospirota bacterium]